MKNVHFRRVVPLVPHNQRLFIRLFFQVEQTVVYYYCFIISIVHNET